MLFLLVMAKTVENTQELHQVRKDAWIDLFAGIKQIYHCAHAGNNLLDNPMIVFQFVYEVSHGISLLLDPAKR